MNNSKKIVTTIEKKIHYKRRDTILNHFRTYFQLDRINYSGICEDNKFSIWRYSPWVGIFYLVIHGQIVTEDDKTKVILSAKLNKAGLVLTISAFAVFSIAVFSVGFTSFNIASFLLRFLFALTPVLAIGLTYLHQRQETLTDIEQLINNVC